MFKAAPCIVAQKLISSVLETELIKTINYLDLLICIYLLVDNC